MDEDKELNSKLLRYVKRTDNKRILIIVPHIINRPYILDLNDDVRHCAASAGIIAKKDSWFFSTWNADEVKDRDTGNTIPFEDASQDLLVREPDCWVLHPDEYVC